LCGAECTVDGPRARNVSNIPAVTCASVDKDELVGLECHVVGHVVDRVGVNAAGHDGHVSGPVALVLFEPVVEEGVEVFLVSEGLAHGVGDGAARVLACASHICDFGVGFEGAEFVEERAQRFDGCGTVAENGCDAAGARGLGAREVARENVLVDAVEGEVRVDVFTAVHDLGEQPGQVVDGTGDVGVEDILCCFDATTRAFPCFEAGVFGAHVEVESVFVLVRLFYYGEGILFEEARQVAEVGVLVELVKDGTGGIFEVRGGEHGDGVWRELFGELGAALKVFESRYIRCYLRNVSMGREAYGTVAPSPAFNRCGWVSCSGCPNLSSAAGTLKHRLAVLPAPYALRRCTVGRSDLKQRFMSTQASTSWTWANHLRTHAEAERAQLSDRSCRTSPGRLSIVPDLTCNKHPHSRPLSPASRRVLPNTNSAYMTAPSLSRPSAYNPRPPPPCYCHTSPAEWPLRPPDPA
jgi:hypothetical protein